MQKFFETERLILRPTNETDAPFVLELFNSPKWLEYIGDRNVNSLEDAKSYIENKIMSQYDKLGYGNYTVIRKKDNVTLGSCGLYDREGLEGVDLGFAFLPEYEGKGYAYEAATKVKQIAFEEFKLKELSAITLEINTSSRKLLERLEFSLKGTIRIPNDDEELLLYKLTFDR